MNFQAFGGLSQLDFGLLVHQAVSPVLGFRGSFRSQPRLASLSRWRSLNLTTPKAQRGCLPFARATRGDCRQSTQERKQAGRNGSIDSLSFAHHLVQSCRVFSPTLSTAQFFERSDSNFAVSATSTGITNSPAAPIQSERLPALLPRVGR